MCTAKHVFMRIVLSCTVPIFIKDWYIWMRYNFCLSTVKRLSAKLNFFSSKSTISIFTTTVVYWGEGEGFDNKFDKMCVPVTSFIHNHCRKARGRPQRIAFSQIPNKEVGYSLIKMSCLDRYIQGQNEQYLMSEIVPVISEEIVSVINKEIVLW